MAGRQLTRPLELLAIHAKGGASGPEDLVFETSGGTNRGRYHAAANSAPAVLWVFGAGGGLDGPAGGLYYRLASRLAPDLAASLELAYRHPGQLSSCVLDVLFGVEYLKTRGHHQVVLVGHSFGGAVVIKAAIASREVVGVAALSSQTYGAE